MPTLSDAEAIIQIRQGRVDCFEHLTRAYTKHIYHFVKGRLFDKNEIDDIVQETFLSFYKGLRNFDVTKPVLPYLYQVARNELKMYYRSRKQTVDLPEHIPAKESSLKLDHNEKVSQVLENLSADQRIALQLLGEGYTYEEIASTIKKPINTVRTIIRRGRLLIKKNEKHGKA